MAENGVRLPGDRGVPVAAIRRPRRGLRVPIDYWGGTACAGPPGARPVNGNLSRGGIAQEIVEGQAGVHVQPAETRKAEPFRISILGPRAPFAGTPPMSLMLVGGHEPIRRLAPRSGVRTSRQLCRKPSKLSDEGTAGLWRG